LAHGLWPIAPVRSEQ